MLSPSQLLPAALLGLAAASPTGPSAAAHQQQLQQSASLLTQLAQVASSLKPLAEPPPASLPAIPSPTSPLAGLPPDAAAFSSLAYYQQLVATIRTIAQLRQTQSGGQLSPPMAASLDARLLAAAAAVAPPAPAIGAPAMPAGNQMTDTFEQFRSLCQHFASAVAASAAPAQSPPTPQTTASVVQLPWKLYTQLLTLALANQQQQEEEAPSLWPPAPPLYQQLLPPPPAALHMAPLTGAPTPTSEPHSTTLAPKAPPQVPLVSPQLAAQQFLERWRLASARAADGLALSPTIQHLLQSPSLFLNIPPMPETRGALGPLRPESRDDSGGAQWTDLTCSCGRSFSSVLQLGLHVQEHADERRHRPRVLSGAAGAEDGADSCGVKLVRGQDMWSGAAADTPRGGGGGAHASLAAPGAASRKELLRCMQCQAPAANLVELTLHMTRSGHFAHIVYGDSKCVSPPSPGGKSELLRFSSESSPAEESESSARVYSPQRRTCAGGAQLEPSGAERTHSPTTQKEKEQLSTSRPVSECDTSFNKSGRHLAAQSDASDSAPIGSYRSSEAHVVSTGAKRESRKQPVIPSEAQSESQPPTEQPSEELKSQTDASGAVCVCEEAPPHTHIDGALDLQVIVETPEESARAPHNSLLMIERLCERFLPTHPNLYSSENADSGAPGAKLLRLDLSSADTVAGRLSSAQSSPLCDWNYVHETEAAADERECGGAPHNPLSSLEKLVHSAAARYLSESTTRSLVGNGDEQLLGSLLVLDPNASDGALATPGQSRPAHLPKQNGTSDRERERQVAEAKAGSDWDARTGTERDPEERPEGSESVAMALESTSESSALSGRSHRSSRRQQQTPKLKKCACPYCEKRFANKGQVWLLFSNFVRLRQFYVIALFGGYKRSEN